MSPTKSAASPTKGGEAPINDGANTAGNGADADVADKKTAGNPEAPLKTAAAIPQATLELGLRLLDASVLYAVRGLPCTRRASFSLLFCRRLKEDSDALFQNDGQPWPVDS